MTGRVVSVWGATGAPGRSSIAIGLATALANDGESVLLVDADTYSGAIAGYLELFDEAPGFLACCRLTQNDELNKEQFARLAHRCSLGKHEIHVLTGITNTSRWPELTPTRIRTALTTFTQWFDYVVVDVGFNLEEDEEIVSDLMAPRRNQATAAALRASGLVVAVSDASVVGLARYIHNLEAVRTLIGETPMIHVVNRLRRKGSLSGAGSTVRNTLHRFAGLDEVHLIDEDVRAFDAASVAAVPVLIAAPNSSASKQIVALAQTVREAASRSMELATG